MVGPFMQGILLIGIIYWYSKSMMSMINDYYRGEFQRKIQIASASKPTEQTTLNVDNFMDYVRELDTPQQTEQLLDTQLISRVSKEHIAPCFSHILLRFMQITGAFPMPDICSDPRSAADSSIS